MLISNPLKSSKKIKAKKCYQRKCYVKMESFYFYFCVQKFSAYNFIWVNIFRPFHDIHFEFVKKKKNLFHTCVLEFQFASIFSNYVKIGAP
jgi:hypothetical protein